MNAPAPHRTPAALAREHDRFVRRLGAEFRVAQPPGPSLQPLKIPHTS